MIARIGAGVSAALLAAIVAFQIALILGAPWGEWTQGGAVTGSLPVSGRLFAAVSAIVLTVLALGLLGRVGWGPWRGRRRLSSVVSWTAVGYSVVAVLLNAATPSGAERAVWLPVSVVLLAAELVTVLGSRRVDVPA